MTIKQLLLLAFLVAGLLPALLVSVLGFYQARSALKAEITHDLHTLNAAVANEIAATMRERMHNIHTWSQLGMMQELQIDDVDKRLANFLYELKANYGAAYTEILVLDTQNRIIASSNAKNIGLQGASTSTWQAIPFEAYTIQLGHLDDNKMAISEAIIDPETQKTIGTLTAYLNWRVVQKIISNGMPPPNAAALFDAQGTVLAQTKNWKAVEAGHEMRVQSALDQQANLPHWVLRSEKLHSIAVAPVHRLGYVFFGLMLATILVAYLLAKPIAKAITEPLQHLRQFVQSAQPQAKVEAPAGGTIEVQALSDAFGQLLQNLHQSEQQLTRAAKLAVVGEMAAALSHEVRTPLGILRSSADLLKREPNLSADGREVTGFMISETERLNQLVNSLIDAARPRPPDFKQINLAQLAHDVSAMLKAQLEAKQIQLTLNALPANIDADIGQMTQVLMNLLQNAIQILPQNGAIALNIKPNADFVEIEVSDNGPGISAENQAHIFEPFFTQRAGGVGLGLAVVRQIVHAHNGNISYAPSQLGGARFTISLPKLAEHSSHLV